MPSETAISGQAKAALLLLLTGVICNAAVIPYISVYIVEGLGKEPWMISIYAMTTVFLTLIVNRQYGEWIDVGKPIAPMIAALILAFALAMTSILTFDIFWVLCALPAPVLRFQTRRCRPCTALVGSVRGNWLVQGRVVS